MEKLYVAMRLVTKGESGHQGRDVDLSFRNESQGIVGVLAVFDGLDSLLDTFPDSDFMTVEVPE